MKCLSGLFPYYYSFLDALPEYNSIKKVDGGRTGSYVRPYYTYQCAVNQRKCRKCGFIDVSITHAQNYNLCAIFLLAVCSRPEANRLTAYLLLWWDTCPCINYMHNCRTSAPPPKLDKFYGLTMCLLSFYYANLRYNMAMLRTTPPNQRISLKNVDEKKQKFPNDLHLICVCDSDELLEAELILPPLFIQARVERRKKTSQSVRVVRMTRKLLVQIRTTQQRQQQQGEKETSICVIRPFR